jgi:hypothetical protein
MKIRVHLHPFLRRFNNGNEWICIPACFPSEIPGHLARECTELNPYLLDKAGRLNGYLNIYVNQRHYQSVDPKNKLQSSDEIEVVTSLVGG